jgi:hypothetical protein
MISWLNFEELLIHNPIELINFSKSNIQVALSKKQYIDFFSNKTVYMGLYYSEEMDFCVMFYADPLQSSKSGEMYAEGYIDVDMKIYRVKVLSNVSISRFNSNFNLLSGTKDFSGDWWNSTAWYKNGTYKGLTVMSYNGAYNAGITKPFTIPSDGIYSFSMIVKVKTGYVGKFIIETLKPPGIPPIIIDVPDTGGKFVIQSYTGSFKAGQEVAMYLRFDNGPTIKDGLSVAGYKIEHGDTPTPYMQSESETTSADLPKWNVTKTGMRVSPRLKQITMVQAGTLMKCEINNNITGWTDGTTQLEYSGQDFIIDGYGMRGLHNG